MQIMYEILNGNFNAYLLYSIRCKLFASDFGLANEINQKLMLKKCGTPGYIAPEILSSN